MTRNPISKLGIGPMSEEIIETTFRYSDEKGIPLMLIASKNQIDWDGGYVNHWKTSDYMTYIRGMKHQYPKAIVYSCRDHCGPGFKNDALADVYATLDADIENGFDLIHIDFCHFNGEYSEKLDQSKKAIEYIRKKNPNVLIEVGTDKNLGEQLADRGRIEEEFKFFTSIAPIHFFVVQTGSLVKETKQAGEYNMNLMKDIRPMSEKYGIFIKEHNADYLSQEEVSLRKNLVDAMNIAPQYGVLQTMITLEKALLYGIDTSEFLDDAYASNKWQKWLYTNTEENRYLCSVIAGHYVFAGDAYQRLFNRINQHENLHEVIIQGMIKNISMYIENF